MKKLKHVKKNKDGNFEVEYETKGLIYKLWSRIFNNCKIKTVVIENLYINQSGSPTPPPPYVPPK
jgi:hypothetical protein